MKSSVEHDSNYGIEGVGRELFRPGHEIACGVVDERVDFAELFLGFCCRGLDGSIISHVASGESRRAARTVDLFARFAQRLFPPADKKHPRAEFGKPQSHGPAEPCPATGKKNGPALQQIFLEQVSPPRPNDRWCVSRQQRDSSPSGGNLMSFSKCTLLADNLRGASAQG